MSLMHSSVVSFLDAASDESVWDMVYLSALSRQYPPDCVIEPFPEILKGDVHRQWAKWFIEGICSPYYALNQDWSFLDIYDHLKSWLPTRFPEATVYDESFILSATEAIHRGMIKIRDSSRREKITKSKRQLLIDLSAPVPHCWVCGFRFHERAIQNFLNGEKEPIPTPPLIDIYKPIGLRERDVRIEVDHVHAISLGGTNDISNLRLSCGWCNRFKSNNDSIYDVSGGARSGILKGKYISLPQPFWVVRVLSIFQRCSDPRVVLSVKDSELSVAPKINEGHLTPTNLRVVAHNDKTLDPDRFQDKNIVAAMWKVKV